MIFGDINEMPKDHLKRWCFGGRAGARTPDLINVSDALLFDFQNFVGWLWYGVFDKNLLERTS
jgi:hypothetical protein